MRFHASNTAEELPRYRREAIRPGPEPTPTPTPYPPMAIASGPFSRPETILQRIHSLSDSFPEISIMVENRARHVSPDPAPNLCRTRSSASRMIPPPVRCLRLYSTRNPIYRASWNEVESRRRSTSISLAADPHGRRYENWRTQCSRLIDLALVILDLLQQFRHAVLGEVP